jgi:hypothetical protein
VVFGSNHFRHIPYFFVRIQSINQTTKGTVTLPELKEGATATYTKRVTPEDITAYNKAVGIEPPKTEQHETNGTFAAATLASILQNELPDGSVYLAQSIKFRNRVHENDTIALHTKVHEVRDGVYSLDFIARNQNDEIILTGTARVVREGSLSEEDAL